MPTPILSVTPKVTVTERDEATADRQFWLSVRRAFLSVVDAIEERYAIPSVIEQHERRKAAQKS